MLGPVDPRVLDAIEVVARRCELAETVCDDDDAGHQVLHAHGLLHAGRFHEAFELLTQLTSALPDVGLERVLARWLSARRAGGEGPRPAGWRQIAALLAEISSKTMGIHRLLPGEQALLAGYAELAVACASCAPPGTVAIIVSGVLRRVGRGELAISVVESLDDLDQTMALTQRGLARRALGDGEAAAEAFAAAAALDPSEVYVIEQARSWFVAGEYERARALLAQLPPDNDPEIDALTRACEGPVVDDPVATLDRFRRAVTAPSLGAPSDATMNLLRSHHAELGAPGHAAIRTAVSGWESPSNRLLIALYATGTGDVARAEYEMEHAAFPIDPMSHRRGDSALVWTARDGLVAPVGPAPSPALRRELADVAIGDDGLPPLWQRAGALAARLDGGQGGEIARAMVHPPEDDAFLATLPEGLYRYQVACACVLAQLPAPWSVRAPLLTSVLFGPIDWVSGAVVLAMGQLAREDAAAAAEIRSLLIDAIDDLLPHSCEPRAEPLLEVLPRMPAVPPHAWSRLQAWFAANHASVAPDEAEDEPAAQPAPDADDRGARRSRREREPGAEPSRAPSTIGLWLAAAVVALIALGWLLR